MIPCLPGPWATEHQSWPRLQRWPILIPDEKYSMGTFSIASIQHLDPGSAQVCEDTLMVFHQAAYWLRLCESQKRATPMFLALKVPLENGLCQEQVTVKGHSWSKHGPSCDNIVPALRHSSPLWHGEVFLTLHTWRILTGSPPCLKKFASGRAMRTSPWGYQTQTTKHPLPMGAEN